MSDSPAPSTPMTPAAAGRIQSAACHQNGGTTPPGSFAGRAQRAASSNAGARGGRGGDRR